MLLNPMEVVGFDYARDRLVACRAGLRSPRCRRRGMRNQLVNEYPTELERATLHQFELPLYCRLP